MSSLQLFKEKIKLGLKYTWAPNIRKKINAFKFFKFDSSIIVAK